MQDNKVVIPKQPRSIEKKNKILKAGLQLFTEKGYYNTNTAEIAKQAGVSTGILYRYFSDKKAIFLEIYHSLSKEACHNLVEKLNQVNSKLEVSDFISDCIEYVILTHNSTKSVHEEFEAMAHYDADVSKIFQGLKEQAIADIAASLTNLSFNSNHIHEKVHMIFDLVDSYCHEVVYGKEECKDYSYLKQTIIDTCLFLLER